MRALPVLFICLLTLPAWASPTNRATDSIARLKASPAGRIVLRSTQRHGGLAAWFKGKALRFHYDYAPTQGPRRTSLQTVDLLSSRAYHDMTSPVKGQLAWDGTQAWSTFDPKAAAPRFWALTPYYFVGMPFVFGDPGINLAIVQADPKLAGLPPADVVKITFGKGVGDAPDDYYYAYFARDDGRLLAVRYVVSYAPFMKPGMQHTPEKILVFEDLKPAGPLTLARTHRFFMFPGKRGAAASTGTVSQVQYGAPFDEKRLVKPAGAQVDTSLDK
jgi:hypothetical protein